MQLESGEYDYPQLTSGGTGANQEGCGHKVVVYPFGRYQIRVEVNATNQFIGITEVSLNRDFLSHEQRIARQGFHDVEQFYLE
jgi:hypothetical protein